MAYPPMIVHYCRHPPIIVTDDLIPQIPIQPDPRVFEAAKRLGVLVDFLVITSNSAHRFQREIEQASGRKVVSMIDATLAEVKRRGWRKVGVLGLGEPVVYTEPLQGMNLATETIGGE